MRKALPQLFFLSLLFLFVISCEKDEEPFPPVTQTEVTLVQFPDAAAGPLKTIALDLTPGIATINVLQITRDAKSPADLNRTLAVKIKLQNSAISDPSEGQIHELPRDLYTNDADNPFDGQYWTVTFQPGEFVTFLKINLDPQVLATVGSRVGLGFQLAEAPTAQISDSKFQLGVELSAKNKWDGVYSCTWTNYHPSLNTTWEGGTQEVELRTTGANTVKLFWPLAGEYAIPSILGGGLSYFLDQEPEYVINTSNNTVTVNNAAPAGTIAYSIAPGFNARYEPAVKTFYVNFGYNFVGGAFDPSVTREWDQVMKYLRAR